MKRCSVSLRRKGTQEKDKAPLSFHDWHTFQRLLMLGLISASGHWHWQPPLPGTVFLLWIFTKLAPSLPLNVYGNVSVFFIWKVWFSIFFICLSYHLQFLSKKSFFNSFFYLGCAGLRWCAVWAFSSCGKWRSLSSCSRQASHCSGFSYCGARALGHSSFGSWGTCTQQLQFPGSRAQASCGARA